MRLKTDQIWKIVSALILATLLIPIFPMLQIPIVVAAGIIVIAIAAVSFLPEIKELPGPESNTDFEREKRSLSKAEKIIHDQKEKMKNDK